MSTSWSVLRSIQNADRVSRHTVRKGTARRILRFAVPYRRDISVFLLTVVLAAGIGVATPLLAGHVINAITAGGDGAARAVLRLALMIAALAVADAGEGPEDSWIRDRPGQKS